MATRTPRRHEADDRPRRRRGLRLLLLPVALAAVAWFAPSLLVLTPARNWPLRAVFAGIDGGIGCRAATWNWFGTIDFRDVVIVDRAGAPVAAVRRVVVDRGLARLIAERGAPGTVRLVGGEALVEVRSGGSSLEDVLAPWLARSSRLAALPAFEIEVVDAALELVDTARDEAWRVTEVIAAGSVLPPAPGTPRAATLAGWTVAGRIVPLGRPRRDLAAAFASAPPGAEAPAPSRLDRTTLVAGATAVLARAGGWSVSSPEGGGTGPRAVAVSAHAVPLGVSRVVATRFDLARVIDGTAELRLDVRLPAPGAAGWQVAGVIGGDRLALRAADTLATLVSLERCEAPIDLSVEGTTLTLRDCRLESPLFRAEASGRLGLPQGTAWEWAETLLADDFVIGADVDLAAAARGVSGGLELRPDVRVTGGQLRLAAVSRAEGTERVLEVRAGSRDLEVLQGTRTMRWAEPFVAWARARRGPGRGERMRVEEARVATAAVEVSAAGTTEASEVTWNVDLARLIAEAGEVLDLAGLDVGGTVRGRAVVERAPATGAVTASLTGGLSAFRWNGAGRPEWNDAEVTIDARAAGTFSGGALVVDDARLECEAGEDRLEATLSGGATVDPAAIAGVVVGLRPPASWVRPAADSAGVDAGGMLQGDLGRWQGRLAAFLGEAALPGTRLAGTLRASAALATHGTDWQITRAAAEVERLDVDGGRIVEPRLVATAAGSVSPAAGRIDVSSAEVLTSTLSLRTGGLSILSAPGDVRPWLERTRGRVQWQFDVGRVARATVDPATAARWTASGRVWGTVEVQETPAGLNLLLDATGSQLALDEAAAPEAAPRRVWEEPRARFLVEVTRGTAGDVLVVDRVTLESSTVATSAAGSVQDWTTSPHFEVGGTVSSDWGLLSRLLGPWTGGAWELAGGTARPFIARGPVAPLAALVAETLRGRAAEDAEVARAPAVEPVEIALPENWLSTMQGPAPPRQARAVVPVSRKPASPGPAADWLRSLSIETSTMWRAGSFDGVPLEAGETALRLFEGQLALGPFDVGFGGGRLRGAPWVQLLPPPGELVVPAGRIAERVVLAGPLADRWMTWMFPLIGRSTRTRGLVSVDVAGARLPLDDPWSGEAAGDLVFENLEVTPGPLLAPLANLVAKLQALVDPRFAFGDKAVLLRIRPDPVRFRMTGGRTWHDGLLMDMGQLVLRTSGSVGHDGSLAMAVEVGFRGDLVAGAPRLAKLLRRPLVIPLKGTVEQPRFDAGVIDGAMARIGDNTAEGVFREGLERSLEGLEELFGNPPPPAPPAPAPPPPPPVSPFGLSFPDPPPG